MRIARNTGSPHGSQASAKRTGSNAFISFEPVLSVLRAAGHPGAFSRARDKSGAPLKAHLLTMVTPVGAIPVWE